MTSVTWWGHSFATIRLGSATVATDPLAATRLFHLRRAFPVPARHSCTADLVVVSHLHLDHLHVPTLQQFPAETRIVVPKGTGQIVRGLSNHRLIEVAPGDVIEAAGVEVEVLAARHDGRRLPHPRALPAPALGFRLTCGGESLWYPGDTGVMDFSTIEAVDLAIVPIGGWGPTLGIHHLDPVQAANAVRQVGAKVAVPVHYGTYWPIGLDRLMRANHDRLFRSPAVRFSTALDDSGVEVAIPPVGGTVSP